METESPPVCPAPRSTRACDRCRVNKAGCSPSSQSISCRRCLSKGLECVSTVGSSTRRPPKRSRQTLPPLPISPAETEAETQGAPIAALGLRWDRPSEIVVVTPLQHAEALGELHKLHVERLFPRDDADDPPRAGIHALPSQSTESYQPHSRSDRWSHRPTLLDSDIEKYLYHYESLYHYFPFLPIPPNWSVEHMKAERPFFLLGILSAMTQHQLALNRQLYSQFLRVLAQRVTIDGQRNLDLLQGTLVQIAWFPMHLEPHRGQIFQVLRTAISMVQDLDYDRIHSPGTNDGMPDFDGRYQAYLTCCYLSSLISIAFHRPNRLPWPTTTQTPSRAISIEDRHDDCLSDSGNLHASTQRVAEAADQIRRSQSSECNVRALGQILCSAVDLYKSKSDPKSYAATSLSIHYARSQLNAHLLSGDYARNLQGDQEVHDETHSALKECLDATKQFLDTFLSMPIREYPNVSFVQWAQLVQVLKIAPRLCFTVFVTIPGWDTSQVRMELRLGLVLESLCYRMHELTSTHSDLSTEMQPQPTFVEPGHFLMFKSVLKILKETYDERCEAVQRDSLAQRPLGPQCPVLNGSIKESEFWDALTGGIDVESDSLDFDFSAFESEYC